MNKIIASASLAALGATSLHAAYDPGLSPTEKSKPWTISGLVRGFYDDNPTASIRSQKQASYGIEISPSLAVNLALDQTSIGFSYTYDLRFYEARPKNDADHTHDVSLSVIHPFNERYKIDVSDRFRYAQEPELETGLVTTLRTQQNYIHNNGRIGFTGEVTPILGFEVSYQNDYWDYDDGGFVNSISGLLDRVEHLGAITGRWQAMPNTVALFGYQFGMVDHTSNDLIFVPGAGFVDPEVRDATSHYLFVGADQNFNSQLKGSVRVGAQFTDYPNAVAGQSDSTVSPYVDASATWTYNPGSYLQLGIKHTRNQTDVGAAQDQESTGVYGVINHRITPKFTGSLLGQYQHSSFKGGGSGINNQVEQLGTIGVNFSYQVNAFVSAEAGYNWDRLDSDLASRSFTRNRVYLGVRATY